MHRLFPRVLLLPLVMLAMLFIAAPASAADGWLPGKFDPHQRVYLDPTLEHHAQWPVNVSGIQEELDKLSKEQGVEFYFVYAQKGSGVVPAQYNGAYAPWQLDELINRWSGQPGFSNSKAVVIYLARSDRNANGFAWAVNGGSALRDNGFDISFWTQDRLKSIKDQYLPGDLQGYVSEIAKQTNAQFAGTVAHKQFMANLPMYLGILAVVLVLLGLFLWRLFVYLGASKRLKAELDEWAPKMDSVTTLFQQLNDPVKGYLDFLTDQKGRMASFTDETKELYAAKLADYTAFVVRRQIAADLYRVAKEAYDKRRFLSAAPLATAHASLTTTVIVVTGKEKALKDITDAFGGTIEKSEFQPDQLLANINDLFNSVNSGLSRIMEAFKKASENKGTIETTLDEVTAMETAVKAAGLSFEPYKTREQGIRQEANALLADITSNPIGKLADSNRINEGVLDLKGDIEKCIQIKGQLPATLNEITRVKTRVATVRSTEVTLVDWDATKGGGSKVKLTLTEKNGNPDTLLGTADQHAAACEAALQAGEWEQARDAKAKAEADKDAADALVTKVLAAKTFVEEHVVSARKSNATLDGKLEAGRVAAATLTSEFLATNFAGQTQKVTTAETVAAGNEGEIAKVKVQYQGQNFLAARTAIESIETTIASADTGLTQVHARLAELQERRTYAKAKAAEAVTKSAALKTKRTEEGKEGKAFTTSKATDDAHGKLSPKVATLKTNVAQDVADWPELAAEADRLVAELVTLDRQVDASATAYASAKQKVGAVKTAVAQAATACEHDDVLQGAQDDLASAQEVLQSLQTTLGTAKSDWTALSALADSKKTVADGAKRKAEQDVEDAKDARTAIKAAATLVDNADGTSVRKTKSGGWKNESFTKSAAVDVTKARAALESARQSLRNRQWKKAKEYANSVEGKIEKAQEQAGEDATQAVVAAIVLWESLNPKPAPEPSVHHRNDDNIGGGFGGGFGGGGNDIGNSIGGGDSPAATGNSIGGQDNNF